MFKNRKLVKNYTTIVSPIKQNCEQPLKMNVFNDMKRSVYSWSIIPTS